MSFKWDWDKRELVEGDKPKGVKWELPDWFVPFLIPFLGLAFWVLVEYVAPVIGRLLFGSFL